MRRKPRAARSGVFKQVRAVDLWRRMLTMLFETGHPWITFKDPCNLRSPQRHAGVVHSSNLCTEITLNTSDDEVAVCNLGSINLLNHIADGRLDTSRLTRTRDDGDADARQRHRHQFLHHPGGAPLQPAAPPGRARPDGLPGRAACAAASPYASDAAVGFADEQHGGDLASTRSRPRSIWRPSAAAIRSFDGSLWSAGHPADRFDRAAGGSARRARRSTAPADARLGPVARARAAQSACAIPT